MSFLGTRRGRNPRQFEFRVLKERGRVTMKAETDNVTVEEDEGDNDGDGAI
jgi:hypothetical protein